MGYVDKSPAKIRSYDADRRAIQSDIRRIDRKDRGGPPGSVISSDEARLVIPGPLADTGRDGQVLTWDEDLHQPQWMSGGGGIVDVASINSTGTAGLPWASGQFDLNFGAATYGSAFSLRDSSAASWLSVSSGAIFPSTAGWYEAWCKVKLVWHTQADAPGASLSIYLNGRGTPSSPMFPIINRGSTWGVEQYVSNGPEWMTPTDYWRVEADGIAASSADIYLSGAAWRITKFG